MDSRTSPIASRIRIGLVKIVPPTTNRLFLDQERPQGAVFIGIFPGSGHPGARKNRSQGATKARDFLSTIFAAGAVQNRETAAPTPDRNNCDPRRAGAKGSGSKHGKQHTPTGHPGTRGN